MKIHTLISKFSFTNIIFYYENLRLAKLHHIKLDLYLACFIISVILTPHEQTLYKSEEYFTLKNEELSLTFG